MLSVRLTDVTYQITNLLSPYTPREPEMQTRAVNLKRA
jgi:hypothetical protein